MHTDRPELNDDLDATVVAVLPPQPDLDWMTFDALLDEFAGLVVRVMVGP